MAERDDPRFGGRSVVRKLRIRLGPESVLWDSTLAVASGLLLLVSFPPFAMEYCAWIALAPLLYTVTRGIGMWRAFWLGWLAGVVFTFFAENWIAHSMTHFGGLLTVIAYAVAFLFASVLAFFPAVFAVAVSQLSRSLGALGVAVAPVVWVASEWLRQLVTGVTWNMLGISQVQNFSIARLSQYGGAYIISFELAAAATLLVLLARGRERMTRQIGAGLILMMLLPALLPAAGRADAGADSATQAARAGIPVKVIGVQPDIPLASSSTPDGFDRSFEQVRALTLDGVRRLSGGKPDLIVWAESPLALFFENDPTVRERVEGVAREAGAHIIANTITREGERYFNSVHIVDPRPGESKRGAAFKRYDKIRLVPFGEYVPWRTVLGRFVPAIVGDFSPGREAVVNALRLETEHEGFAVSGAGETPQFQIERKTRFIRVGSFICYEASYPNLVRQFVNQGATLLINVSNDEWFGETAGAEQHLAHAMMRAIENNRDLVRVTNSGITALVTADGRVVDPLPRSTASVQVWEALARGGARTFYTRHGDVFAVGCLILASLGVGIAVARTLHAKG